MGPSSPLNRRKRLARLCKGRQPPMRRQARQIVRELTNGERSTMDQIPGRNRLPFESRGWPLYPDASLKALRYVSMCFLYWASVRRITRGTVATLGSPWKNILTATNLRLRFFLR